VARRKRVFTQQKMFISQELTGGDPGWTVDGRQLRDTVAPLSKGPIGQADKKRKETHKSIAQAGCAEVTKGQVGSGEQ